MPRRLAAVVTIALTCAACGSARSAHAPARPAAATQALQPTVAQENRLPGTTAWRLPGAARDVGGHRRGAIAGYVSNPTVLPGRSETIYVDSHGARHVRIRIFRIGWYGGRGGRQMLATGSLAAARQPPCAHDSQTGLTRCAWHPTLTFTVPATFPSGVYIAQLAGSDGARADALFIVRALQPAPLLVQIPTATYEAYNAWGGDSLYPGGSGTVGVTGGTQGVAVSYERPYDSLTGAGQFFARDVAMVRFLERHRYPVSYTDSASVDTDPAQLQGHRALIDLGHSEYWSQREADAWRAARDAGESLLMFGSDTMAWRARFTSGGRTIVAYKEHVARDPDRADPSGAFPQGGAPLTGSAYRGCITPRLPGGGPPTYRYYAWTAAAGPPWLMRGIPPGTRIPGIVGYELDRRTPAAPRGTQVIGGGTAPCMAVGAAEPGEPIPSQPGDDRADSTLYTTPRGAVVFSSGTLGWELGLEPVPSASPDAPRAPDAELVRLTRNLLDHVLAPR